MIKKYKIKKFRRINTGGYTILETMVSVALFVVITLAGMGTLLSAHSLHQKSQNMRSIMDNLNFVMEDISRNLRTGYNYHCFVSGNAIPSASSPVPSAPKSCANGWAIAFEHAYGDPDENDDQWIYYIASNGVDKGKMFKSTQGPYTASSFIQLTPDEIVIDPDASYFAVLGAEASPNQQQPFVTIRLVGSITYKNVVTPFSLQTSVSQRLIDI
jgi:type II secretory pathway pseudopilin PulG